MRYREWVEEWTCLSCGYVGNRQIADAVEVVLHVRIFSQLQVIVRRYTLGVDVLELYSFTEIYLDENLLANVELQRFAIELDEVERFP